MPRQPARLARRDHAERVGEREIRVGVRIEEARPRARPPPPAAESAERFVPEPREAVRQPKASAVREVRSRALRRQRRVKRSPGCRRSALDARSVAAKGRDGGQSAHLAQRLDRAERQVERAGLERSTTFTSWFPGRMSVRAARSGCGRGVEELGPFGRAPGVGHIPSDETRSSGLAACPASRLAITRSAARCRAPRPARSRCESRSVRRQYGCRQMHDATNASRPRAAASKAMRSSGWSTVASAKPQTSEAAAR